MEIFENQRPLSFDFNESLDKAQISPNGFREYDVRWLYPEEINKKDWKYLVTALENI